MASSRWGSDEDQSYHRAAYYAAKAVDQLKSIVEDLGPYERESVYNAVILHVAGQRRKL
ncbi:hypothetical protein [Actinomadura sediminis]|uniref:Uncharacterized protein n=1 Tax=Actinomadura sediminis TaxID=1038904 RepID=A0ABW3ENK4_9ACTN